MRNGEIGSKKTDGSYHSFFFFFTQSHLNQLKDSGEERELACSTFRQWMMHQMIICIFHGGEQDRDRLLSEPHHRALKAPIPIRIPIRSHSHSDFPAYIDMNICICPLVSD